MLNDLDRYPNKENWASLVRKLLFSLGFNYVWEAQGVGNYEGFMTILKQRLTDNFIQNWHSRLEESSRAIFYRSIASLQLQPYLQSLNVTKFRNAISKLRMASNRLEIEAGRWVRVNERVPVNERKCRLCNVMEDEYHFVIECNRYNELRKKYIPKYYFQRPSMYKFVELVTTENNTLMKKFGSFVYQAFKPRSEMLYA